MAVWSPDSATSTAQRVTELHARITSAEPVSVASAPATWILGGEAVEHFGGSTVVGLSQLRVAAAVSARNDTLLRLTVTCSHSAVGTELSGEVDLTACDSDAPATETPAQRITARAAGLVHSLISRQVLSRDTAGLNITIVSDIPAGAGLGALHAGDAALALALASFAGTEELEQAPTRARLAEICSASAAAHSRLPVLRARHTAALRGAGETISVIDYSDNSVTQAPHPGRLGVRVFSVAPSLGTPYDDQAEQVAARRAFINEACTNFGVPSLRQLPGATERVVEWVKARREITGADSAPEPETARQWVSYCEEETQHCQALAKALRSQRAEELFSLLDAAPAPHDISCPVELITHTRDNGAVAARGACAGMSQAVIALVAHQQVLEFLAAVADEYEVIEIHPGVVAGVETPSGA